VLDRIGDVASRALEPSLLETDVEQASGRADKGVACNILLVAGLFADKHDIGLLRSFAEDELGCVLVEVAARAGFRLTFELIEVGAFKREGGPNFGATFMTAIPWLSPSTDRAPDCSCLFGTTRSLRNLMLMEIRRGEG
jgi:hypothetical protein